MLKKKDEDKKELEEVLDEIRQRFGEGAIMKLREVKPTNVDVIPTGSLSLDLALGINGVPRGRVIEIFGNEATGKTTLALHILSETQKMGGIGAFIDAEHALDVDYAKKIGVNTDELLISQPDSGEQALEIVESLIRTKAVDAIVIDSVAALTPKAEIEGEMGDQQIGLQARLMSKALRKLSAIVSKTKTLVIFLNQTRMKIGIMFGNPETTPGGMALKFYSSVRIHLQRIAQIKQKDEIVGSRIKAKIVKNKVAAPFKIVEFDIYYNEGISKTADIINTGLKYEVIKRSGNFYEFEGKKIGPGMEQAKEFLKQNPEFIEKIKEEIIKKLTTAH
ncbi:recombinase RecA [bacterium (Candidatus Gribaldobacteria) CG07_land_8_20_14_0_80_33_18]|uniref:Protein RecA n=1 Tax=bacterium (Candidatus Gribaldobacteria) CG07_land_8_20_14_0_80_33_18 TaxID=2014272 RepID=A0A2M6Z3B7_9BACT|nr:MAG: recombinase RecA [bacterium (Candidatus Gribaldobacteria) CG07_land_8_20_14_0_80_33_18]